MTSRIAQLSIVDTLIGALALKRQEQAVKTLEKTYEALSRKRV
jgi:DNA-binding MurR/RpiR family transcriptional regulator